MGMPRIAVVFGGPSPEHDISILTGLMAARTLVEGGVDLAAVYWTKTGEWFEVDPRAEGADFVDGVPRDAKELRFEAVPGAGFVSGGRLGRKSLGVELVLNACHGRPGEDGTFQALLDSAGIRGTGPSVANQSLAMDKLAFGASMAAAGLPVLDRQPLDPDVKPEGDGPFIVKPRFGGSSIGIEIVEDHATAVALLRTSPHMSLGGVLEPFIEGAEDLNVAVRTWPVLQLSPIERPLKAGFYGYREKYLSGGGLAGSRRELPADIPQGIADHLRQLAATVARVAGVRGVARMDFLLVDGEVFVNEINNPPGSFSTYLWREAGVAPITLFMDMLEEAERGEGPSYTVAGADGSALRDAGSIAAKLG
jgi:D-alanine-D-alanine ligase